MIVGLVGGPASAVLVGALIGLTYALLAVGLMRVYRAFRIINFTHGQIGALCATIQAKLVRDEGWNYVFALVTPCDLAAIVREKSLWAGSWISCGLRA